VLLVRAGALGDLLLLRPTIFALKRAGYDIVLLAPERPAAALLGTGPCEVDQSIAWERPEVASLLAGAVCPPSLREVLLGSARVAAYTRSTDLIHALESAGVPLRTRDPRPTGGWHAADWFADAVRDLAPAPPDPLPSLQPSAAERLEADRFCRPLTPGFLALHPGSGSAAKNWPPERFRALLAQLLPERPFLLIRGPADALACAELEKDPRAVSARELPARVLGAALSRAALFVGNDSGVTHLAAAYGAPTLALFGPSDACTWRPLGGCVVSLSSTDGTMDGLPVETVVAAAQELLRRSRSVSTFGERALPTG
jgi:ADP-heptose:LPS heptosyltransferase